MGENFYVLHFTSGLKPWSRPELPLSRYFWKYAKNSAFFERIVETMGETATGELKKQKARTNKFKAMGETAANELNKQKTRTDKLKNLHSRLNYNVEMLLTVEK